MSRIDLNADLGEGLAQVDGALVPLLTSANIACGGHAGDEASMWAAVALCLRHGVRIGAHPAYPDRVGFGRTSVVMEPADIVRCIVAQVDDLKKVAASQGAEVAYFKPHGALYNDAVKPGPVADAIVDASKLLGLPVMCLAGSVPALQPGAIREGFIDRGYAPDGTLIPRGKSGDLLTSPSLAAEQAVRLAPHVDSLCVHSDTPGAPALLASARRALQDAGYEFGS